MNLLMAVACGYGVSPMVTSEELWASRKRLRCCHTQGTHSTMRTSSVLRVRLLISVSRSFRRRKRPRKPFSGSVWLAHSTHLLVNKDTQRSYTCVLGQCTSHSQELLLEVRKQGGWNRSEGL